MDPTVEVSPTSGPVGTVFAFNVANAPVVEAPIGQGRRTCTLNVSNAGGEAIGLTIRKATQTIRLDPVRALGLTDEEGRGDWQAELYDSAAFFAWAQDPSGPAPTVLASAVVAIS